MTTGTLTTQELRDETARQVKAAKKLGRELSEESGKVVEDVGGFVESLGKHIERFGREIRQEDKAVGEGEP